MAAWSRNSARLPPRLQGLDRPAAGRLPAGPASRPLIFFANHFETIGDWWLKARRITRPMAAWSRNSARLSGVCTTGSSSQRASNSSPVKSRSRCSGARNRGCVSTAWCCATSRPGCRSWTAWPASPHGQRMAAQAPQLVAADAAQHADQRRVLRRVFMKIINSHRLLFYIQCFLTIRILSCNSCRAFTIAAAQCLNTFVLLHLELTL